MCTWDSFPLKHFIIFSSADLLYFIMGEGFSIHIEVDKRFEHSFLI